MFQLGIAAFRFGQRGIQQLPLSIEHDDVRQVCAFRSDSSVESRVPISNAPTIVVAGITDGRTGEEIRSLRCRQQPGKFVAGGIGLALQERW